MKDSSGKAQHKSSLHFGETDCLAKKELHPMQNAHIAAVSFHNGGTLHPMSFCIGCNCFFWHFKCDGRTDGRSDGQTDKKGGERLWVLRPGVKGVRDSGYSDPV